MPQVHILRDLKRRTESKTRESASLQRAKRDERTNPSLSAIDLLKFVRSVNFKYAKLTGGRIQVKFETKDGCPTHYALLESSEWKKYRISLKNLGRSDWERLERITFAMDDRDISLNQNRQILGARGFLFYRSDGNDANREYLATVFALSSKFLDLLGTSDTLRR